MNVATTNGRIPLKMNPASSTFLIMIASNIKPAKLMCLDI